MFISGRSEILDFGTYPVFSRKISASTTQSRESVFLIFSFLEIKKISSISNFFSFFLFPLIPSFLHNHKFFPQISFFFPFIFLHHKYLPKYLLLTLHLTLSLASSYWPRETPHHFIYTKPPLFYLFTTPSQIQKPINTFSFHFSLSFLHFTKRE